MASALPTSISGEGQHLSLVARTWPQFPDSPPSCPICAKDYGSINSCAEAAPVLANFSMVMFNPGAFVDVIKCACTDTFQAVFPQCVDCFIKTNQSDILNTPDLPDLVSNIRSICAVASTILGNVSAANGETNTTGGVVVPSPTQTSSAQGLRFWSTVAIGWVVTLLTIYTHWFVDI
ncbi:hypothetical protein AMATHDRAFT_64528 [Amanita thiersii Skay4041]|uniref:Uncharacterized protein n=1 Tax=Amanita thiersii Skay4041 TaxID=703135 RepID=A0A2A9NFK0_9AGAR|nr:hypothetical protein AMATHDRAFT_64528 [Amanita thiersii Skay4041]